MLTVRLKPLFLLRRGARISRIIRWLCTITEPCMQVNYPDSGNYNWNDLPLFISSSTDNQKYYFVEFGGYTGSTGTSSRSQMIGRSRFIVTASASATVTATYTIPTTLTRNESGRRPCKLQLRHRRNAADADKDGYTFSGWFHDAGCSGSAGQHLLRQTRV
jgi:hypothetical protein